MQQLPSQSTKHISALMAKIQDQRPSQAAEGLHGRLLEND